MKLVKCFNLNKSKQQKSSEKMFKFVGHVQPSYQEDLETV